MSLGFGRGGLDESGARSVRARTDWTDGLNGVTSFVIVGAQCSVLAEAQGPGKNKEQSTN